ncbi:MAG: cytochrome b/b6 domain-containing protein, partial [Sphingomonas sp.]
DPFNTLARSTDTVRVWDFPLRAFHWLLAATILIAFLSAEEESALTAWHRTAGWVAALLIAFRVAWGFLGGEHARFAGFLKPGRIADHLAGLFSGRPERSIGHNVFGGIAIIVILGVIGGIVYSGATMQGEAGEGLHEGLSNLLLGLIALHVTAVIAMSLLTRENLILAFITGRKRGDLHPGVPDARPPATLATPIAALVIGSSAYGATLIDPTAFKPGTHVQRGEGATGDRDDD